MVDIGNYCKLKVIKKVDFGYYLEADDEEILLPNNSVVGEEPEIDDYVTVFIYRDSSDRIISTMKKPYFSVGEIAMLNIVSITDIGAFADFGLERDLFIPMKEQKYTLVENKKYPIAMYVDKTERLAGTTRIEDYIEIAEEGSYKVTDEVTATIYDTTSSGSLDVLIDGKYKGLILANEHYTYIYPGDEIKVRVKRIYEDGTIGVTPRKTRLESRDVLEKQIIEYLKRNGGAMPFCDKSSSQDIRKEFNTSKNYFKIALGGLMKKKLIEQNKEGTRLL
ncbi:S1-like domain-containing RNA-binding protein [Clostridium sp. BJN0001]|uniref:CvfB family protein n=1 Tax=Clostridium sp. BJN0001 TaxID=2930219 RepID=UPI001FD3D0AB|nr:S1-like domain-containing RNA-binding protein [Clostridium sp. BJN0001]